VYTNQERKVPSPGKSLKHSENNNKNKIEPTDTTELKMNIAYVTTNRMVNYQNM